MSNLELVGGTWRRSDGGGGRWRGRRREGAGRRYWRRDWSYLYLEEWQTHLGIVGVVVGRSQHRTRSLWLGQQHPPTGWHWRKKTIM